MPALFIFSMSIDSFRVCQLLVLAIDPEARTTDCCEMKLPAPGDSRCRRLEGRRSLSPSPPVALPEGPKVGPGPLLKAGLPVFSLITLCRNFSALSSPKNFRESLVSVLGFRLHTLGEWEVGLERIDHQIRSMTLVREVDNWFRPKHM
jgi:hypothetical protein